ncbi:Major facilitator superfamily domain, general substrate transporter [Niveomyces insectorum RCEF 264]|uniref:Major facilitator superfamily domain, general substrate transporter n=1 Tax=Niveomyces insectorum RCEF 264 TaxID=1081102 RepID=A0A167MH29_9HYPO|nr:Major facilitator superfamily domain, general substrate transporter [Niveomyces insectorum RCEF 264]
MASKESPEVMEAISNKAPVTLQHEETGAGAEKVHDAFSDIDPKAEKRLLLKIDLRLSGTLWILYLLSYMDRTNIANAKIAGMDQDLSLSDNDYSLAIVLFIVGYITGGVPSNMFLSRFRPTIYIPCMMALWGTVVAFMGMIKTSTQLIALRLVLGLVEATFVPAVAFLISTWYKKTEQSKRFMVFTSAAVLSGVFGSVTAGAISDSLDGAHGITGWRWLFIVEGVVTVGIAGLSYFTLVDYPSTCKRFTPEERDLATRRLLADGVSHSADGERAISHWGALRAALTNWRIYLLVVGYHCIISTLSLSYFYPYIVHGLGYTANQAHYVTAFVIAVPCCILADHYSAYRGLFICAGLFIAAILSGLTMAITGYVPRYIFLCFLTACIWTANPISESFEASSMSTIEPEVRAIGLALMNSLGNTAQIYGGYLLPSTDAPRYVRGFSTFTALLVFGGCVYVSAMLLFKRYPFTHVIPANRR